MRRRREISDEALAAEYKAVLRYVRSLTGGKVLKTTANVKK